MGRSYFTLGVSPELKVISIINFFKRYIGQKLEFMHQKICLRYTEKIKENSFDK